MTKAPRPEELLAAPSQSASAQVSNAAPVAAGCDAASSPACPGGRPRTRMPLVIAALGGALYLATLRYGFVWDDLGMVLFNQFARRLGDLPHWFTLTWDQLTFGAIGGQVYRPGLMLSLAADFALWGERAGGFHLTNILLHGLMVWLVFRLTRTVTGRDDLAAVSALLFAVHPTHVEAVAWIAGRTDLWVSVWMATATLCYLAMLRADGRRRAGWYLAALAAMGAGLLFKETAVTLAPLFLVLEALAPRLIASRRTPWVHVALRSLPVWLAAVVHLAVLSRPLQTFNAGLLTPGGLLARVPGSLETFARYLLLLLFPLNMRPFYGLPRPTSLFEPWPLAGAVLFAGLLVLLICWWQRVPAAAFGLAWLLLTLAPSLDLLAFSGRSMGLADRYLYGPSVGLLLVAALTLDRGAARVAEACHLSRARILGVATGFLAATCIVLTAWYLPVWRDNLSLYSRMVRDFPQAPEPHLNLGTTYLDEGDAERGIAELEAATRLRPNWTRPQIVLALAYVGARNPSEGFRIFDRIASRATDDLNYYEMRARAHLLVGTPGPATDILQAGLARFPTALDLHLLLGRALEAQGDSAGAVQAYRRALAMDPRIAPAQEGLGRALARQGDYEAAAQAFARALDLQPDRISSLRFLALAREAEGRTEESLRLWREVARRAQDPRFRAEAFQRIGSPQEGTPSRQP